MATDLSFPLALCKAQWGIWLHTLEMLETLSWRAGAASVAPAHPSAALPTAAPGEHPVPMSRRAEVQEALHTLHDALAAKPALHRRRASSASGTAAARRRKA